MIPTIFVRSTRTIIICSLAGLIFLFSSWQCWENPGKPVAPTWTTQLSVPLIDTVFFLSDALKKNPDIFTVDSNYIYHPAPFKFDPVNIGDNLVLRPSPVITVQKTIGTFSIDMDAPIGGTINATTLIGTVSPTPAPVSSFNWQGTISLPSIPEFGSVHFQSGSFSVIFRNSLPVPIILQNGVTFYNQSSNEQVAYFPADTIQPNSTWAPPAASLTNIFVRSDLKITYSIASPGSNGANVMVYADSGLTTTAQVTDGVADMLSGTIFQRLDYSSASRPYIFDDSVFFQSVTFKKGRFRLQIQNTLSTPITARVQLDEFRSVSTNQPFSVDIPLTASSTVSNDYDLTQWKLFSASGPSNAATCSLSVSTPTISTGSPITLHSTDLITLSLISLDTPYVMKHVSGITKPVWLSLDDSVDLDVGKLSSNFNADSIVFDSIAMHLNLFFGGGFPVDLKLVLNGINSSGGSIASLDLQPGGSPDPNAYRILPSHLDTLAFPNLSEFVSNYLSRRGKRIRISGSALINPPDVYATHYVGTVDDTSSIYSSLDVYAPMSIGVFNGTFVDTLDESGQSGDKIDKNTLTKLDQASVFFNIKNAIPMGINLSTSFENDNNVQILSLPKVGDPAIAIGAGTPESPSQNAVPIRIGIQKSDADKFNDTKRIIIRLNIHSLAQPTPLSTYDYIRIRAWGNLVVNVSK